MSNTTYYSANLINNKLLGDSALSVPATYYLGISTTTTNKNGTGITEPTDGSYARIAITNNKTNFSASASGVINNLVEFEFPESSVSWGTVTHWFLSDAASGGNIWFQGALSSTRTVDISTILVLSVGSLTNTVT